MRTCGCGHAMPANATGCTATIAWLVAKLSVTIDELQDFGDQQLSRDEVWGILHDRTGDGQALLGAGR